jgi:endonuclease/exonuclease/phosphatase family metal-dependent hydrolase
MLERAKTLGEGLPIIMTGDFNAPPGAAPIQYILNDGKFFDTRLLAPLHENKGTFNNFSTVPAEEWYGNIIDYIFVTGDIYVDTYQVVPEKRGDIFLSDHNPVYVKISL